MFHFAGARRRIALPLRPTVAVIGAAASLPLLAGLGARISADTELRRLEAANQALVLENLSYREATGALASQISSLQTAVATLGSSEALSPEAARAMSRLPAAVRHRAMGGTPQAPKAAEALIAAATVSPANTFGVLRELLGSLETKIAGVQNDVARLEALAAATPSIWPAVGWLTGTFGSRSDPFTREADYHTGLDISGNKGEKVVVTANGTVRSAGWAGDYGNMVVVDHEFGLVTRYAHLSKVLVKQGAAVRRGDVLGEVGSTGRATGPHLHYEVWAHGRPLNPLSLLTNVQRR
ncbi:MAG: M23 family metallopeptidase [Vicinamibacteraceae bacterium]|nr:M23 family metallopeptidase [Vicinamibacteraceae bacterium]